MSECAPGGRLVVVGTPIGNLEDITYRAVRALAEADLVAAEDTRTTRKLLAHYHLHPPLVSYHRHNLAQRTQFLLTQVQAGKRVALVAEAGMPGISDPGEEIIRACLQAGLPVEAVPGPTALVTALVLSGLPTGRFTFLGFLPATGARRRKLLAQVATEPGTLVLYEAPHRLLEALPDLLAVLGDRPLAVARELTKVYEQVMRGTVSEALRHFQQHPPRGEVTIVVAGAPAPAPAPGPPPDALERALALVRQGRSVREAVREAAGSQPGARRALYAQVVQALARERP